MHKCRGPVTHALCATWSVAVQCGWSVDRRNREKYFFVKFWLVYGCKVSVGGPAFFSIFRSTKNVWREVE